MNAITLARFWSKVSVGPINQCWEWQANIVNGYGRFGDKRAHRVAYELVNGDIPNGYVVRHKCDNPKCVNPRHLLIGTIADNNSDTVKRNRNAIRYDSNNGNSKLTKSDVEVIRQSDRKGCDLARQFGVAPSTISSIRSRIRRKW